MMRQLFFAKRGIVIILGRKFTKTLVNDIAYVSIIAVRSDYRVIAKPEGLWQSPGARSVSAVQIGGWYQEIATSA